MKIPKTNIFDDFISKIAVRPKKIIPLFLRPLFEETDAGGRFFILIFI